MIVTKRLFRHVLRRCKQAQKRIPRRGLELIQKRTKHRFKLLRLSGDPDQWDGVIREHFRNNNVTSKLSEAIGDGFTALRILNLEISRSPKEIIPIKYQPSTYFRHSDTGFNGMIQTAHEVCEQDENWINLYGIDQLANGRYQPFYTCVINAGRGNVQHAYIAQQFIEPSELSIPEKSKLLPKGKEISEEKSEKNNEIKL